MISESNRSAGRRVSWIDIRRKLRPLAQPVTYLGVVMLALLYSTLAFLIAGDRSVAYDDAVQQGANLVRLFDKSYAHVFKSVDSTLLFLRKIYARDPSNFKLADWVRDPSIMNELSFNFTLIGADGRIVESTFPSARLIGADRSGRDGFRIHLDSTKDELFIDSPYRMTVADRWAIALTRRLNAPDGSFAGVIAAFLDPAELARYLGAINTGPSGQFALLGFDGVVRTRVVNGQIDWNFVGRQFPPRTRVVEYARQFKTGHFWNVPGLVDRDRRLVSYQMIEGFPLVALMSVSEAEVYRRATDQARGYWVAALLLTAGILIAISVGATRERRLIEATLQMEQAKDALARTNEDLETRVVERTVELAQEARRREEVQAMLARTNQELEARVAARTGELAEEMRRREQAQTSLIQAQKMEAVGQLTAGIAHDFNNLLAVIRGSLGFVSDAAKRGVTAEPELIDAALRATRRGRDLVQRLLAFARQAPLRAEPTVVDQLVLDTLRLLQRTLGADIDIVMNLDAKCAAVLVDRNQLANVLLNLALNARDAMPNGGQLAISTAREPSRSEGADRRPLSPTGEDVCIKIADTGMGMTDDVRNRVFEPFFTTKQLGSGLGLSMVHGFVQQSDGLIEIDSKLGEGTTFTIRLPRIEAVGGAEEEASAVGMHAAAVRERSVLLVEDDPDVRIVMTAQLKQLGYQVHAVATGFEAVNWIESPATIDVTLTDIVLPGGLDGVTLVKEAMRRRPNMGVLCMSGYSPAQHHRKWLRVQNIDLLEKPFSTARLVQALESVMPE
jgi:signal transduction histidine kinase/CheY-like chemotaxis protein